LCGERSSTRAGAARKGLGEPRPHTSPSGTFCEPRRPHSTPGLASGGTSSPTSSTADLLSRFGTSGSRSLGHRSGRKTRVAAKIFSFRIVELSRPEEAEDESRMSGDRERHALHGRAATPAVFGRPLTALSLHLHIFHRSRFHPLAGPPVFRVGGWRLRRKRGARCSRGAAPVRRASALQACGPCHDGQSCHRIKALTHARSANVMQTG